MSDRDVLDMDLEDEENEEKLLNETNDTNDTKDIEGLFLNGVLRVVQTLNILKSRSERVGSDI